ncbi:MAG: transporter substrate-binding domain-containing protein [Thalassospira sp.]|uniref:transporter substrate-binding domain-containing protein n=1 Tax=Thalassospira sp. TaxID=1912094 RepID=UPI0032ED6371
MRFAINVGNGVLTEYDTQTGKAEGITVEIARDIARKLDLKCELVIYNSARKVVEDATRNIWDIAFIARDAKRADAISFTEPYILIEANYLVRKGAPFHTNKDVDQPGIKIAAGKGAAYELYLSRNLKHAKIIHTDGRLSVTDMFLEHNLDVAAGIRQSLENAAATHKNLRVLDEPFMAIEQAMATPKMNSDISAYINNYVQTALKTGFITRLRDQFGKSQVKMPTTQ